MIACMGSESSDVFIACFTEIRILLACSTITIYRLKESLPQNVDSAVQNTEYLFQSGVL